MRAGPVTVLTVLAGLILCAPVSASIIAVDYSMTVTPTDVYPTSRQINGRLTIDYDSPYPFTLSYAVLSHDLTVDGTVFHALPEQNGTLGRLTFTDNATPGNDADTVLFGNRFDFVPATPEIGRAFLWLLAPPSFFPTDGLWDFKLVTDYDVWIEFDNGLGGDQVYNYFVRDLVVSASLVSEVAEPTSLALFGIGLIGIFATRRKSTLTRICASAHGCVVCKTFGNTSAIAQPCK